MDIRIKSIINDYIDNRFYRAKKQLECANDFFVIGKEHSIVFKDVISKYLQQQLIDEGIEEISAFAQAKAVIDALVPEFRKIGCLVFDGWAVCIEKDFCKDCPAYQWVVHCVGPHQCRLFVDINETMVEGAFTATPLKECIRPLTVGASYLIASQLGLPEPMVGKLSKGQYDLYDTESKHPCS